MAAAKDNVAVLEYIVGKQKHINKARTRDGATPLHCAAYKGILNVVEYLVAHGADVRAKDKNGNTPLDIAADESVIKYLKKQNSTSRSRRSVNVPVPRFASKTMPYRSNGPKISRETQS